MNDVEEIVDGDTDSLTGVTGGAVADADAKVEVVGQAESDAVRIRVIQLRDEMSDSYFEMGRLLHRVSKGGLYTQWCRPDGQRYDSFREYIEHEVDFAFRKAKHLMSIWWWFAEELKDPTLADKVKEIGWTKAAVLVGVVDKKNADAWIEKAKGLPVKELESEARMALEKADRKRPSRPTSKSGVGDSEPAVEHSLDEEVLEQPEVVDAAPELAIEESKGVDPLSDEEAEDHRTRWTVMLDGPQRRNVEQACDVAAEIAEVSADGKGFCLDFVATSFLALHAGAGGNARDRRVNMRNDVLMAVQRALGVDLVAFEPGTPHAIFGEKTIDRVAAMVEGEDGD